MITCSKSLILESGSGPTVYYKMDDVGVITPDSMPLSLDLDNHGLAFSANPGGQISGCARQDVESYDEANAFHAFNPVFRIDNLATGFSIRLWYKLIDVANKPSYLVSIFDDIAFLSMADMAIRRNIFGKWGLVVCHKTGLGSEPMVSIPLDTDWHRIIATFQVSGAVCTIQVDDGAIDSTSISPSLWRGDQDFWIASWGPDGPMSPTVPFLIDEVGFWREYVFTPADRTSDWNGGSGITYP
jgi:hypothetical protein